MDEKIRAQEYSNPWININSQNDPTFGQVKPGNVLHKDEYKLSSSWTKSRTS